MKAQALICRGAAICRFIYGLFSSITNISGFIEQGTAYFVSASTTEKASLILPGKNMDQNCRHLQTVEPSLRTLNVKPKPNLSDFECLIKMGQGKSMARISAKH
jgi:hypothetical protein